MPRLLRARGARPATASPLMSVMNCRRRRSSIRRAPALASAGQSTAASACRRGGAKSLGPPHRPPRRSTLQLSFAALH